MSVTILNENGIRYYAELAERRRQRAAKRAKQADIAARGLLSKAMRELWAQPDFRKAMAHARKTRQKCRKVGAPSGC